MANNFNYTYVEVGLSHTQTSDYLNQALTLADFEYFPTYSQTIQYQTEWNPVIFAEGHVSFYPTEDVNVFQFKATTGVKYPYSPIKSLDVIPGIGMHTRYQQICYHKQNCHPPQSESAFFYGADMRYWLLKSVVEITASTKHTTMETRNHWHSFGLAYWPTTRYRFGLDHVDLGWAKEFRITYTSTF